MGTGWAVGAATTLALLAVVGFAPPTFVGSVWASGLDATLTFTVQLVFVLALATWAYAISMGAHGGKAALVALAVDVLAAAAWGALQFQGCSFGCATSPFRLFAAPLVVVGLVSAYALVSEIRSRRGPIHWGTAVAFAIPTLLSLVVAIGLSFLTATK